MGQCLCSVVVKGPAWNHWGPWLESCLARLFFLHENLVQYLYIKNILILFQYLKKKNMMKPGNIPSYSW